MAKHKNTSIKAQAPAPVKTSGPFKFTRLYEILAILVVVFLVYGNSIQNDYNLDDAYVVSLDNVNLQTQKGIKGIPEILSSSYNEGEGVTYGYRPLGKVTMAIEYSLWGNDPHYSHAVNILLYALNIFLLLLFIRKLASLLGYKNNTVIYLSLLIFAVHPIHTEVVCSIKNREEILCFIFVLLSLLLFFRFVEHRRFLLLLPMALCTLLAFWSKQTAVTIFGYAMLYLVFRSGSIGRLLSINLPAAELKIYEIRLLSYLGPALVMLLYCIAVKELYPAWLEMLMLKDTLIILTYLFFLAAFLFKRASLYVALKRSGGSGGRELFTRSAVLAMLSFLHFIFIIYSLKGDYSLNIALLAGVKMMLFNLLFYAFFSAIPALRTARMSWFSLLNIGRPLLRYVLLFGLLGGIAILVLDIIPDKVQAPFQSEWIEVTFEQNPFAFIPGIPLFPTGMNTLFFYLGKLLVPYPLGFYYGYDMIRAGEWLSINTLFGIMFILVSALFVLYSLKQNKYLFLSFWILALGFSLFPFLNMLHNNFVTGIVGERLAYQASFPFCVLAAMTLLAVGQRLPSSMDPHNRAMHWKALLPAIAVVIIFSAITVNRNTKWYDKSTLFRNDIQYLSKSARANFMLASHYMVQLEKEGGYVHDKELYLGETRKYLKNALNIYPQYDAALLGLGVLYFSGYQRPDSAMVYLNKVGKSTKINYVRAKELMGDIQYLSYKDINKALAYFEEGYKPRTQNFGLYNKIMQLLFESGDMQKVMIYADTAISYGWPQGYIDKGDVYYNAGDTEKAISCYESALEMGDRSRGLINKLGSYYQSRGDREKLTRLKEIAVN